MGTRDGSSRVGGRLVVRISRTRGPQPRDDDASSDLVLDGPLMVTGTSDHDDIRSFNASGIAVQLEGSSNPRPLVLSDDLFSTTYIFYRSAGERLLVTTDPWGCLGGAAPEACGQAVYEYLEYDRHVCLLGPTQVRPFVSGWEQLPPGCELVATWGVGTWTTTVVPVWAPLAGRFQEPHDVVEAVDLLDEAICSAVECAVAGRGRVACFATGGLDSSLVAAVVKKVTHEAPLLINAGAWIDSPPERALLEHLARHLGSKLCYMAEEDYILRVDDLIELNRGAAAPSGGIFTTVYKRLVELAGGNGCDVVVSGEGGNEVHDVEPALIFDLLAAGRRREAGQAVGFFASMETCSSSRVRIEALFRREPLSARAHPVVRRWYGTSQAHSGTTEVDGAACCTAFDTLGWSRLALRSYERALTGPFGQPVATPEVAMSAPLAAPITAQAAFSIPAHLHFVGRSGVEERHLLRLVARRYLPSLIADHPKVGTATLLQRLALSEGPDRISHFLRASGVAGVGINAASIPTNPRDVPPTAGLAWGRLLALAAWLAGRPIRTNEHD